MISSSFVSGHPGKYSHETPHEYLSGWANLSYCKYFQSNIIISLIWHFFSNSDFLSRICCDLFTTSFVFAEATSSHFFSVTTSTQQLLLRSSYFFRTTAFLRSSFFRTVTFSQQLFFQNSYFQSKTSTEQLLLENSMKNGNILHENRKFFKRVTFWNLFGGGIV